MADTLEQILSQPEENEVVQYAKKVQQQNAAANSTETEPAEYVPGQFYKEFEQQYAGHKPLTAEQQQEADRRERTNKIIAGVGDMLSALSNLYFTTKGAPNGYDPKNSLSGKMMERYDQLHKEREAMDREYNTGLQRARQLDQQYNLSWNQLKEQRERWKAQDERYRRQDEEKRAKAEADAQKEKNANYIRTQMVINANNPGELAYWKAKSYGADDTQAALARDNAIAAFNAKQAAKTAKGSGKSQKQTKKTGQPSVDDKWKQYKKN